jgi:hypothetical protein
MPGEHMQVKAVRRRPARSRLPKPRKKSRLLRLRMARLWPSARLRRRATRAATRAFSRAPRFVQILLGLCVILGVWFALNGVYQVIRKPSELLFPVSGTLNKTPAATWREYGPLFKRYATQNISPELLAALAQVEASGNPLVRTYWRWSWRPAPFEVYRPASSAVGMYQITDGTFQEARRYCIRAHTVIEDGPWNDWKSCWFNRLYTRVIPAHAVELTSAYLDRSVARVLEHQRARPATPEQRHALAALIHLCGAGAGELYVRRGLRLAQGQRCGDHDAQDYIKRVASAERVFAALRAGSS